MMVQTLLLRLLPSSSWLLPLAFLLMSHCQVGDGFGNFGRTRRQSAVTFIGFQTTIQQQLPTKTRNVGYCSTKQTNHLFMNHEKTTNSESTISAWLVENLETSCNNDPSIPNNKSSSITSVSGSKAGENDTIPTDGIVIGNKLRILPAAAAAAAAASSTFIDSSSSNGGIAIIRPLFLLLGRNGWGTGVHPTTRLCLEWLCQTILPEDNEHYSPVVLDYGCGSGILSIAALHLGASHVIGVDVEAEALVTAERNVQLNGYSTTTTSSSTERPHFQAYHVRQVEPESSNSGGLVDICVANILIGQLVRPSMVAVLVSFVKPGGFLCLSGIRPSEVPSLQSAYDAYMEWVDQAELSATETLGSVESYGFDVGRWSRLVGRRKIKNLNVQDMSELAVS